MSGWKAGPEKPKTAFCWACYRRFHGRVFARIRETRLYSYGVEHDVHKSCVTDEMTVMSQSTTVKP